MKILWAVLFTLMCNVAHAEDGSKISSDPSIKIGDNVVIKCVGGYVIIISSTGMLQPYVRLIGTPIPQPMKCNVNENVSYSNK